jgi:hypothetical protein
MTACGGTQHASNATAKHAVCWCHCSTLCSLSVERPTSFRFMPSPASAKAMALPSRTCSFDIVMNGLQQHSYPNGTTPARAMASAATLCSRPDVCTPTNAGRSASHAGPGPLHLVATAARHACCLLARIRCSALGGPQVGNLLAMRHQVRDNACILRTLMRAAATNLCPTRW